MTYCGYHTHTTFSDGKNTAEEMVQAAIRLGMPAIGISDHSPTPCDMSYCMKPENIPAYLGELTRLQQVYGEQITILKGLELDYNTKIDTSPFDYILASVHYLIYGDEVYAIDHAKDIQLRCIEKEFGGDQLAFAKAYFDTVADHITACRPTIVGHFDVITKFSVMDEENPIYQRIALDALEKCVKACPVVEINTGAISRKWRDRPYPADFLLRGLREMGGQVILGADTHAADTIDCAFPLAVELARKAGFDHLLTLWPDGFREQKIV